jgi:phosphoenolpyruvate carboxykinase (GTP)
MADYWQHWVDIGKTLDPEKAPKIFNVNWFRKDDEGNFLWPGFGDNLRVLNWILDRCDGKVDARETAIGYVPYAKDIDLTGIEDEVPVENLEKILSVDNELWKNEVPGIEEFYAKFGDRLPATMREQLDTLKANLG